MKYLRAKFNCILYLFEKKFIERNASVADSLPWCLIMGGRGPRGGPIMGRGPPRKGDGPRHPLGGGPPIPLGIGPLGIGGPGGGGRI